jgi:glycosyltransferase involved in cell wall biosynthesis
MTPLTDERPLFSVIINNYNYGRYIEEAIESVLNQTFPQDDIEIIVVDDGSTDDSLERINKYQGKISCIYQENSGQAAALNAGIVRAKGRIISFLDSDDYWDPMKLECVSEEFKKSESMDFVYHFMNVVDNKKKIIDRYVYPDPLSKQQPGAKGRYLDRYLKGTLPWFSPTSGMTIKADCLKNTIPIPSEFRICADLYLHYMLPFYIRELSLIKEPLGYNRLHGMNLTGGNLLTLKKLEEEKKIMLLIERYIKIHSKDLGYDNFLLIKRFESVMNKYQIMIYNLQGMKTKAMRMAAMFNGFLPADTIFYKAAIKSSLLVSVMIPSHLHLWLQRRYRSLLYLRQRNGRGNQRGA